MKCVKFLLVFFNSVFWLCGAALIVVGILAQISIHKTVMVHDPVASGAPIVIIGVGVVIFFIAFFGCCGAWKENYCMVTTFAVLLTLIIIVEVAAAIAGYIFRRNLKVIVHDSLNDIIEKYSNGTEEFRHTVDELQENLQCCGVNSSADWDHFKPDMTSVPDSCCVKITKGCGIGNMHKAKKVNQQGCAHALEEMLKTNIQWVIVAALVIAFLQIMGIVLACLLMRGIRSGYEVM